MKKPRRALWKLASARVDKHSLETFCAGPLRAEQGHIFSAGHANSRKFAITVREDGLRASLPDETRAQEALRPIPLPPPVPLL